jgi:two-component system response regulator NreC
VDLIDVASQKEGFYVSSDIVSKSNGPSVVRILIADDHDIVRRGIALILQSQSDMEVVGEAVNGLDAVKLAESLAPDIILMDIDMPDLTGLEATKQISHSLPDVSVLILTAYDREDFLFEALQAGASGYVLKAGSVDDLLHSIRTIRDGEVFLYPHMVTRLVNDYVKHFRAGEETDTYVKLSAREREVLPLLAEGETNNHIAELLHLSPFTVQTYRQRIMKKLDLHGRTELLKYAIRRKLVKMD